jgi:hypothetical protein
LNIKYQNLKAVSLLRNGFLLLYTEAGLLSSSISPDPKGEYCRKKVKNKYYSLTFYRTRSPLGLGDFQNLTALPQYWRNRFYRTYRPQLAISVVAKLATPAVRVFLPATNRL